MNHINFLPRYLEWEITQAIGVCLQFSQVVPWWVHFPLHLGEFVFASMDSSCLSNLAETPVRCQLVLQEEWRGIWLGIWSKMGECLYEHETGTVKLFSLGSRCFLKKWRFLLQNIRKDNPWLNNPSVTITGIDDCQKSPSSCVVWNGVHQSPKKCSEWCLLSTSILHIFWCSENGLRAEERKWQLVTLELLGICPSRHHSWWSWPVRLGSCHERGFGGWIDAGGHSAGGASGWRTTVAVIGFLASRQKLIW